jgi:hypothetical protein
MVHPERLGAFPVANAPAEDVLHLGRHLSLRDLALHNPGGVGLPPVLKGRVDLILDGLDEPTAEAYRHCATGQPLRLQLFQVVEQGLLQLSVSAMPVGWPLRVRNWSLSRPSREHQCGVVEVEPLLLPAGGVVGENEVDVL